MNLRSVTRRLLGRDRSAPTESAPTTDSTEQADREGTCSGQDPQTTTAVIAATTVTTM